MAACPKCGAEVSRVWKNKRRQHVGKCGACKRLVSFGRNHDSGSGPGGSEQTEIKPEAAQERKEEKQPARDQSESTSLSSRTRAIRKRATGNKRRAVRVPQEQPAKSAGGKSAGGFLERLLGWVNSEL